MTNRKQRRAAHEKRPLGGSSPVHATFAEAHRLHQMAGIAYRAGRYDSAADLIRRAIALAGDEPAYHSNLALVLKAQGKLDEAVACYDKAIGTNPNNVEAYSDRGDVLRLQWRLDEAVASYERAIALRPDSARAHNSRGAALQDQGKLAEAVASYERAVAIEPAHAEAHNNRGGALKVLGRLDEAVGSYERAIVLKPDFIEALNNLALTLMEQGHTTAALALIRRSLHVRETPDTRRLFVACVKRLGEAPGDPAFEATTVRALSESWGRPGELVGRAMELVRGNAGIAAQLKRATAAWPRRLSARELFGVGGATALAVVPLLTALLESTPIGALDLEYLLTMARSALLETATETPWPTGKQGTVLGFFAALARQCFINEYVFSSTEEEERKAAALKASVEAAAERGAEIPVPWLVAVASYFPLSSLSQAARLLKRKWPSEVTPLLTQQVSDPLEEASLRAAIPRLTDIDEAVSRKVREQYEENPYPRWIKMEPATGATSLHAHLAGSFPLAAIEPYRTDGPIEILIAGCGTGQHSIATAQQFPTARVLAIDLSLSSLAYAVRKTRELGVTSIEYAQADLLKVGSLGRRFDVVESSGVLHHLEDPWAGWRALLSVLRPGGFMMIGLYSAAARQDVVKLRRFIAEQGYGSTADEIRRARHRLVELNRGANSGLALTSHDFFSLSSCRDLLFHVQEHQMTLAEIESFLGENDLTFLGFEIDGDVRGAYRSRFPDDPAGTNLGRWQAFENENPSMFFGMYQFWVQKKPHAFA